MSLLCRIGLHAFLPPKGDGMNRSYCPRCGEWWIKGLPRRTSQEMTDDPSPKGDPRGPGIW